MDLKSGYPYFFLKNGLLHNYEQLQENYETEVLILGGGISGLLVAHALVNKGIPCCVIDARGIGMGSTCASTSLLQYEIDISLHELAALIGKQEALFAYRLCSDSIDRIETICREIVFTDFTRCRSLYFLDTARQRNFLEEEFRARKEAGFEVTRLTQKEILQRYGLKSPGGILSEQAAKIDAYRFTHTLCTHNMGKGLKVFEQCEVRNIKYTSKGPVLKTTKGFVIKSKKLVYATGYEIVEQVSKPIVKLKSTYACASNRIPGLSSFFTNTLFWNTSDPYLYLREDDGRIIVGGRDENFYDPVKRDRKLPGKVKKLKDDLKKLFPRLEFEPQFSWAGTFGSTKDGLPYIGCHSGHPHCYFALGFGGNGITFSAVAADMIAAHITGETNGFPQVFSFNR